MIPKINKLYADNNKTSAESIEILLRGKKFKLEQIVSRGDSSPSNFWYDQEEDEWVVLLKGHATLEFESASIELSEGDYILIPAHLKHRVDQTSENAIWLALHAET